MVQLVALEGFEEWEEWGVGGGLVWWVAVGERWGRLRPRREREGGGRKSGSEPGRRASQNSGERNRLEPRLIMDLDLAVTDSRSLCNSRRSGGLAPISAKIIPRATQSK